MKQIFLIILTLVLIFFIVLFIYLIDKVKKKREISNEPTIKQLNNFDLQKENINARTTEELKTNPNDRGDKMATIINPGRYVFGKNIPVGMYDLTVVSGGGWLTIYDKNDDEHLIWLGEKSDGTGAKKYSGITSDIVRQFTLEGNVEVKITKTEMLVIEE